LERLGAIESGAECARWLPLLSALADGEATAQELAELRPHLRSCSGCRATLRDAHAVPEQVAMLVPPAVVEGAMHSPSGSLAGHVEGALHAVVERATMLAARVHGAFEALSGAKLAAVAASTAAIAGGGVALEQATTQDRPTAHRSAGTTAVTAAALTRSAGLTTIGFPRAAATGHHTHRATRAGEFTPEPSSPSEFTPSAPRSEFAAAEATPPAAVASAPAPAPAPPSPRPNPSEFVGP
jgi:hypothetical protein